MWAKLAVFILKNRLALLIILFVATCTMAFFASKVEVAYDQEPLVPKTDSVSLDYERFRKKFGTDGNVMVIGVQTDSLFTVDFFRAWDKLKNDVSKFEGIERITCVTNTPQLVKNDSLKRFEVKPILDQMPTDEAQMDSAKRLIARAKLFEGLLLNTQTNATLMAISYKKDILGSRNRILLTDSIVALADAFASSNGIETHYSGLPYVRSVLAIEVRDELKLFSMLSALVTAVVLLLIFRSFYAVLFPLIVVIIGAIFATGTIVLMGFKITLLTGLIPPLIVVTGIPNCVYLMNKYHHEYRKHRDKQLALHHIIEKIGVATLITNATTAIGFGVFSFTGNSLLEQFGIVAGLNVMLMFVISIVFIPVVFSFLPPPTDRQLKHLDAHFLNRFVDFLVHLVNERRRLIFAATGFVVALSLAGMSLIKPVGFIVDDVPKDGKLYQDLKFFERHFKGIMPLNILIDSKKKGGIQSFALLKKTEEVQDLLSQNLYLSRPVSVVELLKAATQAYYNGKERYYRMPSSEERKFVLPYASKVVSSTGKSNQIMNNLTDSLRQVIRISLSVADIGSAEMEKLLGDIKPKVERIFEGTDTEITFTGTSIMFFKGNKYLINSLISSLALAFILIGLAMATLFRSFRIVFISIATNTIPLLFTAGIMGYFDIYLKPSTVLIFSIALGIAVDDSIHYLAKYKQELMDKTLDVKQTVLLALHETGSSMIYTSVILFFGFIIFGASDFQGTVALGVLTSITLGIAMFSNLIVLPALLITFDKKK